MITITPDSRVRRGVVDEVAPGIIAFYLYREGRKPTLVTGRVGKRACGARCRNSLGPSCTCRCGGHNHGRDLWEVSA